MADHFRQHSGTATQGISESAVVAAGHNRLALGKSATTLVLQTHFESQKGLVHFEFWPVMTDL